VDGHHEQRSRGGEGRDEIQYRQVANGALQAARGRRRRFYELDGEIIHWSGRGWNEEIMIFLRKVDPSVGCSRRAIPVGNFVSMLPRWIFGC
jgi:hypothetical protein